MQNSLIKFGQASSAVMSTNPKTGGTSVRLLTAREFKNEYGLKGKEATRQYNDYLRAQGRANTAGLAAALTSGELLVKGFSDFRTSLRVSFVKASKLKDPKTNEKPAVTRETALAELGLTEEKLAALLAAQPELSL